MSRVNETRMFREISMIGFCIACAIVMFCNSAAIYQGGWVTALLIGILAVSWVPMNVLAVLERRTLLNPKKQYWQFYFGDLLFLPGAMACMAALQTRLGHAPWHSAGWTVLCFVAAIAAGIIFHWGTDAPKEGGYSSDQWNSPTKVWHDLYVIPVFLFYLAIRLPVLGSPVAWTGTIGWLLSILTLIFVALWASLMFVDGGRKPSPLATAHVDFDWYYFRPAKV